MGHIYIYLNLWVHNTINTKWVATYTMEYKMSLGHHGPVLRWWSMLNGTVKICSSQIIQGNF